MGYRPSMMMTAIFGLRALAFASVILIHTVANSDSGGVVVLDASNFESYIAKTPLVLVEFYAPWCGHCKQLAPEYAAAATILSSETEPIPLAKMDASDEKNQKISEQYDVQGFPSLKLFKNKKASDYMGERTATAIVHFMRIKAGPPTIDLDKDSAATAFKDGSNVTVIGFFKDKKSEAYKAFETAAGDVDDIRFGTVHDNGIRKLFRAELDDIIVYKNSPFQWDEKRVVFDKEKWGGLQPNPIAEFVRVTSMPLIVPFNEANSAKIFGGTTKVHLITFIDSEKDTEIVAKLAVVAAKYVRKVLVVTVGPREEQITEYFGISASDMPAVRLVDMSSDSAMKKYVYDRPAIDEESIQGFVDDFLADRLKATLKTEEPPTEEETRQEGSAVKVLVSKNFKTEVIQTDKLDVLVEFYAPWCGHCKELAPQFEALADKLKHVETLVIAKVNAEANEIEDVAVEGFPTLRLWPAGKKNDPVEYTGGRTAKAIEEWLEKEVTNKWDADAGNSDDTEVQGDQDPGHKKSEL